MYNRHSSQTARMNAIAEVKARQWRYGWQLLLNEHKVVHHGGDSIAIIGVENSSRPPFPDYGNLAGAMECDEGQLPEFKVLLSHDPTHWRREVLKKTDIQLQLSGHTHATQFRLFGWSPASFVYDEYAGLYEEQNGVTEAVNEKKQKSDSRKLFICTGTGGNVTFRFGAWPAKAAGTAARAAYRAAKEACDDRSHGFYSGQAYAA
jgi:predicted MPP superfamily phosphohydrolase